MNWLVEIETCIPLLMLQVGHVAHIWLFELVKISSVQWVYSVFSKLNSLSEACFLALEMPCSLHFSPVVYWVGVWQEKAPYEAKAAKRKSEYEKLMTAYNKKQVNFWLIIFLIIKWWNVVFSLLTPLCLTQESTDDDEDDDEEEQSDRSKSELNDQDKESVEVILSSASDVLDCLLFWILTLACAMSSLLMVDNFFLIIMLWIELNSMLNVHISLSKFLLSHSQIKVVLNLSF